jgi:hypothetical protein
MDSKTDNSLIQYLEQSLKEYYYGIEHLYSNGSVSERVKLEDNKIALENAINALTAQPSIRDNTPIDGFWTDKLVYKFAQHWVRDRKIFPIAIDEFKIYNADENGNLTEQPPQPQTNTPIDGGKPFWETVAWPVNQVVSAASSAGASQVLADKTNTPIEAIEFAKWLEENTKVIYEEKITLYRYEDFDGAGNYTLDDIYTVYCDFEYGYFGKPKPMTENKQPPMKSKEDVLEEFMDEERTKYSIYTAMEEYAAQFKQPPIEDDAEDCIKTLGELLTALQEEGLVHVGSWGYKAIDKAIELLAAKPQADRGSDAEAAAEKYCNKQFIDYGDLNTQAEKHLIESFIAGAKWAKGSDDCEANNQNKKSIGL